MDTIARVKRMLDPRDGVCVESTARSITVEPRTSAGFPVTLEVSGDDYRVYFDGWHENFTDEAEAVECFRFGLSSRCRLVTVYHGTSAVRWTVESHENGAWRPDSTTGLLLVPFWRKKRVVQRSNSLDLDDIEQDAT